MARLQPAVAKALRERDLAERMANLGMELRENGTEHYARFVREDLERYAAAVKTAGVKRNSYFFRSGVTAIGSLAGKVSSSAWSSMRSTCSSSGSASAR